MAEEESTGINEEEEEHLPSAEEAGEEGEESEEYVFEDEEPLPAGTVDVKALEIMVAISDLLNEALTKNLDPKVVAEKIRRLQARLRRVKRKKRKQAKQARRKPLSKGRKSRR